MTDTEKKELLDLGYLQRLKSDGYCRDIITWVERHVPIWETRAKVEYVKEFMTADLSVGFGIGRWDRELEELQAQLATLEKEGGK